MSQRMVTQNVTSSNIFVHQRTGECIFDLLRIEERAVLHSEKKAYRIIFVTTIAMGDRGGIL